MAAYGVLLPAPAAAHKIYRGPISGTFKTHKKALNSSVMHGLTRNFYTLYQKVQHLLMPLLGFREGLIPLAPARGLWLLLGTFGPC